MANKHLTPTDHCPPLAKAIGVQDIYLKREDLHPLGSHKGRSIPVMIDYYYGMGDRRFAISSSGNAALAAALHIKSQNEQAEHIINGKASLDIFVGNNIDESKLKKLQKLESDDIRVLRKERPLQALTAASENGMRSLRQSTDDVALIGYKSLAEELSEVEGVGSIFIGTSSGTTAQALAQYFSSSKKPLQVHIVQTSSCHRLSESFETFDGPEEKSIADAIVDQTARRKNDLIPMIKKVGGYGWIATNEDIETAQDLVKKHAELEISTNSALSVVGAMHAAYRDWDTHGAVLCIICGD